MVRYYNNPLKGLLYPTKFVELWNEAYPQHPITIWDQDIRRQAPPNWSSQLKHDSLVLIYQGEDVWQGINDLLRGPTTMDCGMVQQLLPWIGIRYLIGDRLCRQLFKFEKDSSL